MSMHVPVHALAACSLCMHKLFMKQELAAAHRRRPGFPLAEFRTESLVALLLVYFFCPVLGGVGAWQQSDQKGLPIGGSNWLLRPLCVQLLYSETESEGAADMRMRVQLHIGQSHVRQLCKSRRAP